ncbi:MAG: DUF4112 domain-containing protein [Pyrinomonadaceae bacterium]
MKAFDELTPLENRSRFGMTRDERKKIKVEESLETLARYLDGLVTIPGINWKFGLYSLVGLIPGAGDTATALVSFYILASAVRYGVPKITLVRMGLNIAIGYIIGIIPVIGDAFDFVWKPNKKNMALIRARATVSADEAKKGKTSDWLFVGMIILILVGMLLGSILLGLFVLGTMFKGLWDLLNF